MAILTPFSPLKGLGRRETPTAPPPDSSLVPAMTSNSSPSPYVISASSEYLGLEAYHAFDSLYWVTNGVQIGWIKVKLDTARIVHEYKITTNVHADETGRAPKSWLFQGSNTSSDLDADFTSLDTQTSVAAWSASETRNYPISNTTGYQYYRIKITENFGDAYLSIGKIEFWGV